MKRIAFLASCFFCILASGASAAILYTDGFETYTAGANPLDKNVAGPNAAPNGSGNPWFGPAPPNARVAGTDSTNGSPRIPPSGRNTIRGSGAADLEPNRDHLASRQKGANAVNRGEQDRRG